MLSNGSPMPTADNPQQYYTWIHEHTLKNFQTTFAQILPLPFNYIT